MSTWKRVVNCLTTSVICRYHVVVEWLKDVVELYTMRAGPWTRIAMEVEDDGKPFTKGILRLVESFVNQRFGKNMPDERKINYLVLSSKILCCYLLALPYSYLDSRFCLKVNIPCTFQALCFRLVEVHSVWEPNCSSDLLSACIDCDEAFRVTYQKSRRWDAFVTMASIWRAGAAPHRVRRKSKGWIALKLLESWKVANMLNQEPIPSWRKWLYV